MLKPGKRPRGSKTGDDLPPEDRELRCGSCNGLLGEIDETGLTIRRGELEANFFGSFRASIRCYQRRCKSLNVRQVSTEDPRGGAAA